MSEGRRTVRYEAFYKTAGDSTEGSELYRALLAGLCTLQLVDRWLDSGTVYESEQTVIKTFIADIPETNPERRLLANIVEAVLRPGAVRIERIGALVFAYAQWLHEQRQWRVASDVYGMLWEHLTSVMPRDPRADWELAARAALSRAACLRLAGLEGEAAAEYTEAGRLGAKVEDRLKGEVIMRRADLGLAKLTRLRGDLPLAETQLRDVIARCASAHLVSVRADTWHDLGNVLYWRGKYEEAVGAYYESWEITYSDSERLRICVDLGSALSECGWLMEAREALLLVTETASDLEIKAAAIINLMEIARLARREPQFHEYRVKAERELEKLPPPHRADFHYYLAIGLETFGYPPDRIRAEYGRSMTVAQTHRLGQAVVRADEALAALDAGRGNVTPQRPPAQTPASITRVAYALNAARQNATVGAGQNGAW